MHQTLDKRFYQDPEWHKVTDVIINYILPLRDILNVDVSKDAEDVKAQVIARQESFKAMDKFLQEAKFIDKPLVDNKNIFR